MKARFFGVRGSIPSPGPNTIKYGGNTSCVMLETPDEKKIIIDAGTGLRDAGMYLMGKGFAPGGKGVGYILFSHTHWDHIQGFPFFVPAYIRGNEFNLYGEEKVDVTLEDVLKKQQMYPNFPVLLKHMPAKMVFNEIMNFDKFSIGDNDVYVRKLNHPNDVMSFRIENKNGVFVYASDTEHYSCIDTNLLAIAENADVLIYDAQYTPEEYPSKLGWGHSTYEQGVKIAKAAGVKQLVLFHHDPPRTDEQLDEIEKKAQTLFPNTIAACEGLFLEIIKGGE